MRKAIRVLVLPLLVLVLIALGACSAAVSRIDAERVSTLWDVLGPRQREYIAKDPALANDADSRAKRIETVDRMDRAVRDLKESSK